MSGDVSSVAESRAHPFNAERELVSDGLHRFTGGDSSDKCGDIDPGSGGARFAEPDVRVHEMPGNISIVLLPIVFDSKGLSGNN